LKCIAAVPSIAASLQGRRDFKWGGRGWGQMSTDFLG
jgi:hypothetical protein